MRIVVLGAGATGSLFGARLSAAGEQVLLVGRPAHVEAVLTGGLVIEGVGAGTHRLDASAELAPGSVADAVLVTVKSFDLASAVASLARAVAPTPTVLLGNGLGLDEVARAAAADAGWAEPERWIVRAVHTVPATLLGPGRVRASGSGEVVLPDPLPEPLELLDGLFRRAGVPVRRSSTFDRELWRKAVVNAAVNPVTALHGVPNGRLLEPALHAEADRLLAEAVEVAWGEGVDLPLSEARADLDRIVRATAENRSSMLQDLDRGRPTEVEAISGEILRRGASLDLELPATRHAVEALRARGGPAPEAGKPS